MSADPQKQSARAKGRTVSLRMSTELAAQVEHAELRLRITAAELLQVSLGKTLQELERSGKVVLALDRVDRSAAPPAPVIRLPDPLAREVLDTAETVGVSPLELVREGVRRVVDELRAEGYIRFSRRSAPDASDRWTPDPKPASAASQDEQTAAPLPGACEVQPDKLAN